MAQVTPKYKLRVDWDGSTGFEQTGADATSRLIGNMECWSGRDGSSNLVHRANGGGLVAMLNNESGDYSPFNTSSPLTGNLSPDKDQKIVLRVFGRAAQFTAANSEALSGGDVLDIVTDDFTLSGWLYIDSLSAAQGIVNKRDRASSTNLGYAVELQTDGTLDFLISDGTAVTTISSTTVLTTGTWAFWVLTADRSGNAQFYINNGAAEGAASISSQNGTLANAIAFELGAGFSTSRDRFFGGRMVSVALSTKLLSSAERTFLWRDSDGVRYRDIGLTGDGSALKTSLQAWYDLQEESGNRADSENSNTLTDTNTVTDAEGIPNYSLWAGFLADVEPVPGYAVNRARLVGVGPLTQVNQNKIRLILVENEVTGTAIARILTEAGWPTNDRTIDTGKTTMTNFWLENEVKTLTALRRVERTETGFIRESKDGRIVFEDRRRRQTSPHNTSQATFTDASGGALVYVRPLIELDSRQQLFHIFRVPVLTYTDVSIATLWTLSSSGANSPAIQPGETLAFFANYPNPSSATNAWIVKAWTTPAENTDYEANSLANGTGDDKSSQLTVSVSKFGNSMKISITNNDAAIVFLTLLQARGTSKTKDDPTTVSIETAATYQKTFPDPPQYIPDVAEANDWGNWHNGVFSTVQPLLAMTVVGNRDPAHMAQVLDRAVSDRITVVAKNSTGLGIDEQFYIESERHVMNARMQTHLTTWGLSPAANQDAWTLGTSKLGTETRVAY